MLFLVLLAFAVVVFFFATRLGVFVEVDFFAGAAKTRFESSMNETASDTNREDSDGAIVIVISRKTPAW